MNFDWILSIATGATIAAMTSAVVGFYYELQKRKINQLTVREEDRPEQALGLILLIGIYKSSAPSAIEYHLPKLRYCWLMTSSEGVKTAQALARSYPNVEFYWGDNYIISQDDVISSYRVSSNILNRDLSKIGLEKASLMADITGGTKPMTAGLVLACSQNKLSMQYMKSPRDSKGEIVGDPLPIKVRFDAVSNP
jgi:hypothetical protein